MGCTKRHPACHATCETYIDQVNRRKEIKEAMRKEQEIGVFLAAVKENGKKAERNRKRSERRSV
jgi:hypothetical protein